MASLITAISQHLGTAAERASMTTTDLLVGSTFYETDNRAKYIWDGSNWYLLPNEATPENTVTVAPSGGDYTTIQAAITAVGAGGLVLVYPGTYTDDTLVFTGNNQGVVGMGVTPQQHVTTANAAIVNFAAYTDCRINNIKMTMTAVTTAKNMITGSGSLKLRDVHLGLTCATDIVGAAQPSCISVTGDVTMKRGTIDYNHTGETVAGIKAPIVLGTGSTVYCERTNIDIDTQGDALATVTAYGVSTGVFNPFRCTINVTNIPEVDSGLEDTFTIGHGYIGGSGTHELARNSIHVENNASTGIGIYAAGTVVVRSMDNHIHVESTTGTANSYYFAASGAAITAQFDDVIAANDENNVAGGTFTALISDEDGDLHMTGKITGEPKHLRFNLADPNNLQSIDGEWGIVPAIDAAITISRIQVTLNAAGNEIAGDLKYADTFIGLANAVVINTFDTTSGVLDDSSITSGSVSAGKTIYLSFDSAPSAAITQAIFDITYSYD